MCSFSTGEHLDAPACTPPCPLAVRVLTNILLRFFWQGLLQPSYEVENRQVCNDLQGGPVNGYPLHAP